jgi:hypothetical protein
MSQLTIYLTFYLLHIFLGGGKPSCSLKFRRTTDCWGKACAGEKATATCPWLFFHTNGEFLLFTLPHIVTFYT